MPKQKLRISHILLAFFFIAAIFILMFRIPFGVDVTDTSFWTAEPYLITQGAIPYVNNWSQTPLTSLVIAPLVWFFTTATGGTEGIMFFMFSLSFFFRLAVPVLIWLLLRRSLEPTWAAVFCILFFVYDYGLNRYLNYNFLSQGLLTLGGALLWNALEQENSRAAAVRYAWAGLVMALCALSHVTQIVNCLLFAVFLLVLERRRWKGLPCWFPYVLSGLAVAVTVIIGLEWAGGGGLFSGLQLDLAENNYFQIPHLLFTEQLRRILWNFYYTVRFVCFPFFGILALYLFIFHSRGRRVIPSGFICALVGSCGCYFLFLAHSYALSLQSAATVFVGAQPQIFLLFLAALMLFFFLSQRERRRFLPGFLFFCCSGFVSILLSAVASHSPADYRFSVLSCGALFAIPLAAAAFQISGLDSPFAAKLHKASLLFLTVSVAACSLSMEYAYVYRDDPIPLLTCRVEEGVYRGLYTTPERAAALQNLEKEIRARTSSDETVLFADLMPMAYLMTDAKHCTPTTWDPCHYRYGFQDDTLYQSYFKKTGQTPDKIFFIQSEENPLSIDDPENAFAAWVKENYTLVETVGEGQFSFRLFAKTNSIGE